MPAGDVDGKKLLAWREAAPAEKWKVNGSLFNSVGFYLLTPAALARIVLKLTLNPFASRSGAMPGRDRIWVLGRKC
jgi:hypothetical protein